MGRKSLIAPPLVPSAPPRSGKAVLLSRRLAELSSEMERLLERIELLGARNRLECRHLAQGLETRRAQLALRVERLTQEVGPSERRWAQLERSCDEIVEHLGFLSRIVHSRTPAASRRVFRP